MQKKFAGREEPRETRQEQLARMSRRFPELRGCAAWRSLAAGEALGGFLRTAFDRIRRKRPQPAPIASMPRGDGC